MVWWASDTAYETRLAKEQVAECDSRTRIKVFPQQNKPLCVVRPCGWTGDEFDDVGSVEYGRLLWRASLRHELKWILEVRDAINNVACLARATVDGSHALLAAGRASARLANIANIEVAKTWRPGLVHCEV
jgi:hypothetical protein